MMTDPIGDFLTRIRNACMAGQRVVKAPTSKMKEAIAEVLKDMGFIRDYKVVTPDPQKPYIKEIWIALKYHPRTREPIIQGIKRISKPGLRKYCKADEIPKVRNGLGIAILSTSKGIMHDKRARKERVGGEIICYVW